MRKPQLSVLLVLLQSVVLLQNLKTTQACSCTPSPGTCGAVIDERPSNCQTTKTVTTTIDCECETGCEAGSPDCNSGYSKQSSGRRGCFWGWNRATCRRTCTYQTRFCTACQSGFGGPVASGGIYYTCTKSPTNAPTKFPTRFPTNAPTKFPTNFPTKKPTGRPTRSPTPFPTDAPTKKPTFPCGTLSQTCGGVDFIGGECCEEPYVCIPFNKDQSWCYFSNTDAPTPGVNDTSGGGGNEDGDETSTSGDDDDEVLVWFFAGGGFSGGMALVGMSLYARQKAQRKKKLKKFMEMNTFRLVGEKVVYEDDKAGKHKSMFESQVSDTGSAGGAVATENPLFKKDVNVDDIMDDI